MAIVVKYVATVFGGKATFLDDSSGVSGSTLDGE